MCIKQGWKKNRFFFNKKKTTHWVYSIKPGFFSLFFWGGDFGLLGLLKRKKTQKVLYGDSNKIFM